METSEEILYCSFCGKWVDDVNTLVVGINAYICDWCINTCIYAFRDKGFLDQLPELKKIADSDLRQSACTQQNP